MLNIIVILISYFYFVFLINIRKFLDMEKRWDDLDMNFEGFDNKEDKIM